MAAGFSRSSHPHSLEHFKLFIESLPSHYPSQKCAPRNSDATRAALPLPLTVIGNSIFASTPSGRAVLRAGRPSRSPSPPFPRQPGSNFALSSDARKTPIIKGQSRLHRNLGKTQVKTLAAEAAHSTIFAERSGTTIPICHLFFVFEVLGFKGLMEVWKV